LEKRDLKASALRTFFGEQWEYLLSLVQDWHGGGDLGPDEKSQIIDAVEDIVDKVDSRIRGVGSYQKKLRCSAYDLLIHIQTMVSELPEALILDRDSYINEALINSIFSNSNDLNILLSRNEAIDEFAKVSKAEGTGQIYALLFSIREEADIFGYEMSKNLMQRDVPQTAVNFHSPQIIAPALSEEVVRSSLKEILFKSAVASIRSKMVKLRHNQSHDEQQQAALHPEKNINNPEVYLKLLIEQLSMPVNVITLQSNTINMSKMGILLPESSGQSSNRLHIYELAMGGNYTQVVTIIRFNREEWLRQ